MKYDWVLLVLACAMMVGGVDYWWVPFAAWVALGFLWGWRSRRKRREAELIFRAAERAIEKWSGR